MRIKEFASRTNLSAKTIRYYEEIGLVSFKNSTRRIWKRSRSQ